MSGWTPVMRNQLRRFWHDRLNRNFEIWDSIDCHEVPRPIPAHTREHRHSKISQRVDPGALRTVRFAARFQRLA